MAQRGLTALGLLVLLQLSWTSASWAWTLEGHRLWHALGRERAWQLYGIPAPAGEIGAGSGC